MTGPVVSTLRSTHTLSSPRLRRLAERAREAAPDEVSERCELCGLPVPAAHRHVLDLASRNLMCVCRACSVLFDRRGAGAGKLRLVPDRRLRLVDFTLTEATWEGLRIPVDMAFFFRDSGRDRVVAFYPGAMGATESRLELDAWRELEVANPVLAELEPDVEALLVNRARGERSYWIVPLEDPYRLVALIRTRWRGFTGGTEVWAAIDTFFADLDRRARAVNRPSAAPAAERS